MRWMLMAVTALLVVLTGLDVSGQQPRAAGRDPTAQKTPLPWITRQTRFNIPFSVQSATESAAAVELYVSRDQGNTWQIHNRQPISARQFGFHAADQGEYWFASRTVIRNQPPADPARLQPELTVVVDFAKPELHFEAKARPGGDVESSIRVSDQTLDPSSLKIEYQSRAGEAWKAVVMDQRQMKTTGESLVGKIHWRPDADVPAVHVRAEVTDRAGNKSVVNRLVLLPRRRNGALTDVRPAVPPNPFEHFVHNSIDWPDDNRVPRPTGPAIPDTKQPAEQGWASQPITPIPDSSEADLVAAQPVGNRTYPTTAASPEQQWQAPVATQFDQSPPGQAEMRRIPLPNGSVPPPENAEMTRSRRFKLDYAIESAGPSGVRKVELWGTSDGGGTWSVWMLDDDRTSPIDVQVDEDGVYGFRVVVVANNGLAGAAPRNGEAADLWVGVDTLAPTPRITAAKYGDQQHFGHLDIRWTVDEAWLSDDPVTLLYSDQATGPWTTIRSGLPNTGQYYWPIEPRIPEEIYLRIEVRDRAANVGSHQLTEAVRISGLIPKAHIRGIAP